MLAQTDWLYTAMVGGFCVVSPLTVFVWCLFFVGCRGERRL